MKIDGIQKLFGFDNFIISKITFDPKNVNIQMHRDKRKSLTCPNCNRKMMHNKSVRREVHDLPVGTALCVLIQFDTIQGKCPHCKTIKTFLPDGVSEHATATTRLKKFAFGLCRWMAPSEVAEILPYSDDTIRRWDKEILKQYFENVNLDNVRNILIDEKYLGKKQKFVTLVLDADTGELLHMKEGKSGKSLTPFFEQMTKIQRSNVLVACMDRNASYPEVVRKYCPNARIVYDKFHIVKNLSDAIDQVRREETKKAEKEKKPIIKGERYNLLRNAENLKESQRVSLQSLLSLNENINAAYILKEEFRLFWSYTYLASASKFLANWTLQAVEYGLTPLVKFGQGLLRDKREVLASLQTGYTSASIERFNVTVSRIIRRGYGYRDLDYLFLKLRQQSVKKHLFHSAILR